MNSVALTRLFFALWPDPELRRALAGLLAAQPMPTQARPTAPENLHLTLDFVGEVPAEGLACLRQRAAQVRVAGFSLQLDYLSSWRKKGILWLGASADCPPLRQLAAALREVERDCGGQPETRIYQPHLTLARRHFDGPAEPQPLAAPLRWEAREFALVSSTLLPGRSDYQVLQRWPLLPAEGTDGH